MSSVKSDVCVSVVVCFGCMFVWSGDGGGGFCVVL